MDEIIDEHKPSDDLVVVFNNNKSEILADKKSKYLEALLSKDEKYSIKPLQELIDNEPNIIPIPDGFDDIDEYILYYNAVNDAMKDHLGQKPSTYIRETKKIHRNDFCLCGSGKKYKFCCLNNH